MYISKKGHVLNSIMVSEMAPKLTTLMGGILEGEGEEKCALKMHVFHPSPCLLLSLILHGNRLIF